MSRTSLIKTDRAAVPHPIRRLGPRFLPFPARDHTVRSEVKNNLGPRGGRGGMARARACAVAYRAGVIVGAVDMDIVDDESERLRVVRDLLLRACNNGKENEGEREPQSGKEEAGVWKEVKPVWVAERAAVRRPEAELGVARVGFRCEIVMMRSEVDRGGIMMVGTEVSVSTSGSPSASGGGVGGAGLIQEDDIL
ncbi:hypothetical protein BGW80DRAFT_1256467 [Lactifluus volemus]|nr:hypothetical protein BGW80DRAFT_1256467 [Lactifluus volemus]